MPETAKPFKDSRTRGSQVFDGIIAMWWLVPGTGWRWHVYLPTFNDPTGAGKVYAAGIDQDESRDGLYRAREAARSVGADIQFSQE